MVLGILSVMVIMAVAFAISMRTERVAAGNYADSVRARQLVQVGLARALNKLVDVTQNGLGSNGLSSPDSKVYPDWLAMVFNPIANAYTNTSKNVYLLYSTNDSANEATNFVPRALWSAATNADETLASNTWVLVESVETYTINGTNYANTNQIGRVKYLILNCSGLLDANFAGDAVPVRGVGASPRELAVQQLGELPTAPPDFFVNRNSHVRYETLNELAVLNNFQPTNFCVYSHCPPGYWDTVSGTVLTQVNLAGNKDNLEDRREIITNAFYLAGFDGSEAGVLYRNLIDYVDPGFDPGLYTTCVEPVPMINEIVFQCVSEPLLPADTKTLSVRYELWFPFVAGVVTCSFNGQVSFGSALLSVATVSNNFVVSSGFKEIGPFPVTTTDPGPFTPTIVKAEVLCAGLKVDELDPNSILSVISIVNDEPAKSLECLDPRFNKDLTASYWRPASVPTLSVINKCVTDWWTNNPAGDTDVAMYVANTNLHSVGELGYLAYAPWKTVKLYGPNRHRVLDVFGLDTNYPGSNYVVTTCRGLVNPNSRQMDALAAVFANMPVDQYPGDPAGSALTMDTARKLYSRLTNSQAFVNGFTNLSDIGYALTNFEALDAVTFDNELKRESLFRNTCGLLSVRQNLFTIIIEAHVASGGNIPRNPVRQRAVALVWRDPYTGEMFVRQIKWLRD